MTSIETGCIAQAQWKTAFHTWMTKVDAELAQRTGGFGSKDLADQGYADYFDDGMTPSEAAECAFNEESF